MVRTTIQLLQCPISFQFACIEPHFYESSIRYSKYFWWNLSLQEVFRCLKWCFYFAFSFIDAVHMMHIMIEVIANKSTLRVTCTNVDTNMILISNITQHHILITQHHYNAAFVDEHVDTKKLLIFLVENVVTNRLLIILSKRWQL